jgi:hypothetical protein
VLGGKWLPTSAWTILETPKLGASAVLVFLADVLPPTASYHGEEQAAAVSFYSSQCVFGGGEEIQPARLRAFDKTGCVGLVEQCLQSCRVL